ncbi:TonB-dependent receptor domain-containing protein [Vibrio mediterranei]|uniref:TonB-dependent receptor domain-containing protein n=1 Tax=Vibrio mediterranei TaxID=689 RepID=UPI00148D4DE4|nr:TonB-dependent receptor [Vibrio mediterranei]NOI22650.1 TonB-dependent receptor [Vibrio mediterranei]
MNKSFLAIAVAASLSSYASFSLAEATNPSEQSKLANETMVVTANRVEQSLSDSIASTSVITKQQIDNLQVKTLTEALALLPGVQVYSNGGRGQQSSVFIRGNSAKHTIVLYNGVRLGSATSGTANFTAVPIAGVERIELVRGARASVYGADAIGGVINIITTSNVQGQSGEVSLGAGTDNYRQGKGSVASQIGDNAWLKMGINSETSDGFDVVGDGPFPVPSQPDDDGYRRQDITFELGAHFASNFTGRIVGFNHSSLNQYDSSSDWSTGKMMPDEQEAKLYSYAGILEYRRNEYSSNLTISTNRDDSNQKGGELPGSHLITDRHQANWLNTYKLNESLLLQGGLDFTQDSVANSNIWNSSSSSYLKYGGSKRDNKAVYLGAILDGALLQLEGSLRYDDNSVYGGKATWQLGAGYRLSDNFRLIASSGTGFQAPTYNDLYWPDPVYKGNPDLKPEESLNIEGGIEGHFTYADFRLVAFSNKIDNLISYQSKGEELKNSDATIKGIELSSNFETGYFTHSVSLDFLDHNNKVSINGDVVDRKLARRADFVGKYLLSYMYQAWRADVSYQYQGERYDDAYNNTKLDPYSLLDLVVSYSVTDNWLLRGKVVNALDEEYETSAGYRTQRRAFFFDTTYKF